MFILNQQMQNYVSQQYVFTYYILLYVSTFLCHHQEVLHLRLAKLHKFLKLKLLNLFTYTHQHMHIYIYIYKI